MSGREVGLRKRNGFTHDAVEELAAEIAQLTPGDLDTVYPLEAARRRWKRPSSWHANTGWSQGGPEKHKVLALAPSYHGNTLLALSASSREQYQACYRSGWSRWSGHRHRIPFRCECGGSAPLCAACSGEAIEAAIQQAGPDTWQR